jgi:hypothetical protein
MLFFLPWSWLAGNIDILPPMKRELVVKLNREFRIQSSPSSSLAFFLSRWRSAQKLDCAAQNARISHGQTSNVCLKRTTGLAISL